MFYKICSFIGIIDIIISLFLVFTFAGTGDLGEAYFSLGSQYLMIGVVKQ